MKALELFSGTKSFGKEFLRYGDVVSLDICNKNSPTINTDVMTWNYKEHYDPHYFDVIWASPPCTEYSTCLTTRPRDLKGADAIVKKTLEIIDFYNPTHFFIENPYTGLLKDRPFMEGIDVQVVDYCKYGFAYRKRTGIWTSANTEWHPRPLCKKDCQSITEGVNGRKKHKGRIGYGPTMYSRRERHQVPPSLIAELLAASTTGY